MGLPKPSRSISRLVLSVLVVTSTYLLVRALSAPAREGVRSSSLLASLVPGRGSGDGVGSLEWLPAFGLYEDERTINVEPVVAVDPAGGFLVADVREAEVRRYGGSGETRELLWRSGGKGGGPGEFTAPTAVTRLPSGEVVVADRMERLAFYGPDGAFLRSVQVPIGHIEDVAHADGSLLLIAGRLPGGPESPRLHLWDMDAGRIVRSFFTPFSRSPNPAASTIAGWTKFSIRGDRVAAVFATCDTVYFFSTRGDALGSRPIPFRGFRRGEAKLPDGGDPRERARWLASFDFVADVHWLPDGRLLIPYQNVVPERAMERRWHLLRMDRSGRADAEVRDLPRLLDVDGRDGTLYFVKRGAEAPNQWEPARLRG